MFRLLDYEMKIKGPLVSPRLIASCTLDIQAKSFLCIMFTLAHVSPSQLENTYQNVPEDDLKSSLRVKFTRKFFRKFMV